MKNSIWFNCIFIFLIVMPIHVHAQFLQQYGVYANDFPGISIETLDCLEDPEDSMGISFSELEPDSEYDEYYNQAPMDDSLLHPKHASTPYGLRIGDRLQVSVYGESGTIRNVVVDPSGSISYLFINSLFVMGKSIDHVRHEIQAELRGYYRNPLVLMTLVENVNDTFVVLGQVNVPGKKNLIGNPTVTSALSMAKGFTTRIFRDETVDLVDLDRSFISRNGQVLPVDFTRLIKEADITQDIPLEPNDYIYIAGRDTSEIYILGEVNSQMELDYFDTITLGEALAEAGGVTLRASSRVVVIRGSLQCPTYFLIDINRIYKGRACDFFLQPGDIVFVPPMKFTTLKEIVKGAVRTFVSTVFSIAGASAWSHIHGPIVVNGEVVNTPVVVPTINVGGFNTGVTAVSGAAATSAATAGTPAVVVP